jgi:cell division protein FtsW
MSYAVSPYYYFIRQVAILALGLILFFVMIGMDSKKYYYFSWLLLLGVGAALVILLIIGQAKNQAISWFDLGIISIQPSEFAKVIAIVWVAGYYETNIKKLKTYGKSLFPMLVCGFIAALIFLQPDLGTTIIFTLIMVAMFLLVPIAKDIKYKTIIGVVGLGVLGAFILISTGKGILLERQKDRFDFAHPCDSLLSKGNQVCNCYIAINNGGLFGVGLNHSTQKYLYLPEAHTDFIFPIIVEELGLIVGIIVILGYAFILYRILKVAKQAENMRCSMIAYGAFWYLGLHILINLLGVLALMPLTGVPLPLLSYGGSFTVNAILMLFLVERVNIENKDNRTRREIKAL